MSMRVRISHLKERKQRGEKFAVLTAYDATIARLLERAGVDVLLVGDSVATAVLGYDTTLPVTLEVMIHHTAAVVRGTERALVVADMPFLTYQVTPAEAVRNAGRLLKDAGAAAVKIEGGRSVTEVLRRLVDVGIPVMGHLGVLPQSVNQQSGYRQRGSDAHEAELIFNDALALQDAGAFAVVLEAIPAAACRENHSRARCADRRHRRRAGLRRTGARQLRFARSARQDPAVRETLRQPERDDRQCRARVRRGRARFRTFSCSNRLKRSPAFANVCCRRRRTVLGLVPTMGALHAGHAELIKTARRECDVVVVSIFVNPLQFDRADDFARYPKTLAADLSLCRELAVDLAFTPAAAEIYPEPPQCTVDVGRLADHLCGRFRPGHFRGVATVVLKLFHIVGPHRAYFGEKDAQQTAIVRRLVADLNVPVGIVEVPTVREADGLALSSRNRHLSVEQRQLAVGLFHALQEARQHIAGGERDAAAIKSRATERIAAIGHAEAGVSGDRRSADDAACRSNRGPGSCRGRALDR